MRPILLCGAALAACIDYAPPPRAALPPRLVAVTSSTALDALGRAPSLHLRFDAPVADPADDDVVLVTGAPSPALRSALARPPLAAGTTARRIPATLARESDRVLRLEVTRPLAPETGFTLVLAPALAEADPIALRVASAARGAPLASLPRDRLGPSPGAIPIVFDRGVVGHDHLVSLEDHHGVRIPAHARLDCHDGEGYARCAWLTPQRLLAPGAHRIILGELRARHGGVVQPGALAFVVEPGDGDGDLGFGPAPPCAPDERAVADLCAMVRDREIVVRVATRRPAVLRARATPGDQGDLREVVSPVGPVHTLRFTDLRAHTRYALTLWALDLHRQPVTRFVGAFDTPAPQGDLRITEVLARPRHGPAQEFVELTNDGPAAVPLAGWSLHAVTGRTDFEGPTALPPGGRAVVVGAGFDLRAAPAVAGGATLVVVRGALLGRGLRDDGSDLALHDPTGAVASRFPGARIDPRPGVSIVRAARDVADDDPGAWCFDAADDATPGAPDRLR